MRIGMTNGFEEETKRTSRYETWDGFNETLGEWR